jgi:hypothetical protein
VAVVASKTTSVIEEIMVIEEILVIGVEIE